MKRSPSDENEPTGVSCGSLAWIPVTERLPESGETVLVWHYGEVQMAWLNHFTNGVAYFVRDTHYNFEPSHWMPLPAPPADAKQPANAKDQRLAAAGESHE